MNTKEAANFLTAFADTNEVFISLSVSLRLNSELKQVHHGFNLRKYNNKKYGSIEIYVEAEINDDLAYCWWLDVNFGNNTWEIDASLLKTCDGEQHTQSRLVEINGKDLEDLSEELKKTVEIISGSIAQHFKKPH